MRPPLKVLAIDPGTYESGYVIWDGATILESGIVTNSRMRCELEVNAHFNAVVIEMVACYGMPVGKEVFETCVDIGRYLQIAKERGVPSRLVYRLEVKTHLCHSIKAKDSNIRQALIDRLGAPGTKKQPGPTYGIRSHMWAALALAVTAWDAGMSK